MRLITPSSSLVDACQGQSCFGRPWIGRLLVYQLMCGRGSIGKMFVFSAFSLNLVDPPADHRREYQGLSFFRIPLTMEGHMSHLASFSAIRHADIHFCSEDWQALIGCHPRPLALALNPLFAIPANLLDSLDAHLP